MLGLKNLFSKKKNDQSERIVNVDTFRIDYYEKNVIPEFNKYWNDEFVCEKLGLKTLMEGEVVVNSELTQEEINKCAKILTNIVQRMTYASVNVFQYVSNYVESNAELQNAFKKCSNKQKEKTFLFHDDSYLVDCFIESYNAKKDSTIVYAEKEFTIDDIVEYVKGIRTINAMCAKYAKLAVEQALMFLAARENAK